MARGPSSPISTNSSKRLDCFVRLISGTSFGPALGFRAQIEQIFAGELRQTWPAAAVPYRLPSDLLTPVGLAESLGV
jgi:hypothetical protein